MEFFWVPLGVLLASTFLLFFFLVSPKPSTPTNVPPGNTGWPIVGEMWEFIMTSRRGVPEKFITDRMQKYSSEVFRTSLLGQDMVVFCGARSNKFLFSNEDTYVNFWLPKSVKTIFGSLEEDRPDVFDLLSSLQKFLPNYLKPAALRYYIPIMDSCAKQQVEKNWSPYKQVRIYPLAKKYTFELACKMFMNLEDPERIKALFDNYLALAAGILSLPVNFPGSGFNGALKAGKEIRKVLTPIIEERKKELQENNIRDDANGVDMLTRLLQTEGHEKNALSKIVAMLFASYDTLSTSITFTFYFLSQHPDAYEKVFQEQMAIANSKKSGELLNWDDVQKMKYTWWATCEAMRIAPPSPGTFREAIVDFTYAGFTIPKGWKISWMTNTTHKNPEYFPEPNKYDPSRFEGRGPAPFSFVPFGGGPHMCPGKEYARVAILAFIHNVVIKFKFKKLNMDEKIVYIPTPAPSDGLLVELVSIHDK